MYLRAILLLTIMLLFLVAPEVAMAQSNIFQPVAGDKSIELLSKMFGNLFEALGYGGNSDPFSSVILTFNGAVLTIGGVLVSYTILIGTIGTAHDGEMLGKKFSSAWVPIRTAAGTALVLPVIGGSYCVMQALVGWLIVQGVGLADKVWTSFVTPSSMTSTITVNMSSRTAEDTVWKIFSNLTCVRTMEEVHKELLNNPETEPTISKDIVFGHSTTSSDKYLVTNFGATTPLAGLNETFCGISKLSTSDFTNSTNLGTDLIERDKLKTAVQTAALKQQQSVKELITKLDAEAKTFAGNPADTSGTVSRVKIIAKEYAKKTLENATTVTADLGSLDKLSQSASQDGWVLAGAWYMRMSYLLDQASKIAAYHPSVTSVKSYRVPDVYADLLFNKYSNALGKINEASKNLTGIVDYSKKAQDVGASKDSGYSDLDKIFGEAFKSDDKLVIDKDSHPIMAMKNLGNTLINSVGISIGIIGGAIALGAAFPALGSIIQGLSPVVTVLGLMIFPPLVAVGFTLSYVLPMMPFMIWIGVVLGWVILCVEAIIAAPMWAVMHLSPHGDDMVGTGSQGYRLVLSLMLRPVLMIFGLIAALTIITVMGQLINGIFVSIFDMSQVDSGWFVGIVGTIASSFIYMGLMWTLITKTMSIIHVIPDQLLQWFGGGGPQIGDYGQTIGGHGSQSFAATAAAGSMIGQLGSAAKQIKDLNLQHAQAKSGAASVEGDKQSRALSAFGGSSRQGIMQSLMGGAASGADMEKFNSHEGMQIKSEIDSNVSLLGGEGSEAGQDYLSNLKTNLDNGDSFSTASKKAMKSTFQNYGGSPDDPKPGLGTNGFGKNQATLASNLTEGTFGGKGMKEAMGYISAANERYKNLPPNLKQQKVERFFGNMLNEMKNSNIDAAEAFEKTIKKRGSSSDEIVETNSIKIKNEISGAGFTDNPTGQDPATGGQDDNLG